MSYHLTVLISLATFNIRSCASFPTGVLTRPLHRDCQLRTNYKINSCVCPSGASVFPATIHCAFIANYHGRRAPLATEESTGPRAVTSFRRQVPVDSTEPITEQFIYSFPVISSDHSTPVLSFILWSHTQIRQNTRTSRREIAEAGMRAVTIIGTEIPRLTDNLHLQSIYGSVSVWDQ